MNLPENCLNSEYSQELKTAIDAARKAGEIMDEYRGKEAEVEDRKLNHNDIVTEADLRCQRTIVERIREEFPDDGFLAEEEHLEPEGESRVWVIDPIDGTFNFSKGFPYFCTSIALRIDGEHKVGVVLSPESALGELYFASSNTGSYMTNPVDSLEEARKISVSDQEFKGSRIAVSYSEIETAERQVYGDSLNRMIEEGAAFSRPGAAALNACMVARGSLDGWICHCWEWDFAAGKVIVEEAGGKVEHQRIESTGQFEVVASNGELHGKLLKFRRVNQN